MSSLKNINAQAMPEMKWLDPELYGEPMHFNGVRVRNLNIKQVIPSSTSQISKI